MTTATTIRLETRGPIAHVTLDGPEVLNAINLGSLRELARVIAEAGADESVRAIVLTGEGRAFCSGANLTGVGEAEPTMAAAAEVIQAITTVDVPVIAAVNGPAVGYGAGLVAVSDMAVAAESAYVLLAFTAVGLVPDGGTTYTMPTTVGRALAGEMALTGRRLSAEEARSAGLVSRVVTDHDLTATVQGLVEEVIDRPRRTIALAKAAMNRDRIAPLAAALEAETRAQVELLATDEFAERSARFRR